LSNKRIQKKQGKRVRGKNVIDFGLYVVTNKDRLSEDVGKWTWVELLALKISYFDFVSALFRKKCPEPECDGYWREIDLFEGMEEDFVFYEEDDLPPENSDFMNRTCSKKGIEHGMLDPYDTEEALRRFQEISRKFGLKDGNGAAA
jgi:hypothetical protein